MPKFLVLKKPPVYSIQERYALRRNRLKLLIEFNLRPKALFNFKNGYDRNAISSIKDAGNIVKYQNHIQGFIEVGFFWMLSPPNITKIKVINEKLAIPIANPLKNFEKVSSAKLVFSKGSFLWISKYPSYK